MARRDDAAPDGRFEGRTAIVTGSTGGIGEATAKRLAREGANVVVTGLERDAGQQVATGIRSEGGEAVFVAADLGELEGVRTVVETASDTFGEIHAVVNNAAVQSDASVADATLSHWEEAVRVNLRAYWLVVREALEHMPRDARIINVSSNHAYYTMPGEFPYNVLKSGVEGMTRAMAVDLAPLGIRANAVTPGWVLTERTRSALSEEDRARLERIHPVGRLGRPADIAGTISWLLSEDAEFVNGSSILVDGGRGAVMQDDVFAAHNENR